MFGGYFTVIVLIMNYRSLVSRLNKKHFYIFLTVVCLLVFYVVHIQVTGNTFFTDESGNIHSTNEGYGDVPLHLSQISKFAYSSSFDLREPIYYGATLQYPFLLNLIRGLILQMFHSWSFAVLMPLYLLIASNIVLVFFIYFHFLKNKYWSIAALSIFFLGSGPSGWMALFDKQKFSLINTGAQYPLQNVDFGAPLVSAFTNQQTFIFGLFAFLIFIFCLLQIKKESKLQGGTSAGWNKSRYVAGAILSLGLLPLIHTHGFVAAVVVLFAVMVLNIQKISRPYFKKLCLIASVSGLLALQQLHFLLAGKTLFHQGLNFTHFRLGWMLQEGMAAANFPVGDRSFFSWSYLSFNWQNFGLILPLFALSLVLITFLWMRLRKVANEEELVKNDLRLPIVFGLSGIILLTLAELVQFQPWDFDNNKILVYFLFLVAPLIVWSLAKISHGRKVIQNLVITIVMIFLTLSGGLDTYWRLKANRADLPIIFNPDSMAVAKWVRENVSEDEIVLTSTNHLSPVSSLAGRQVLVGYPGWLWTRGIDYSGREKEVEQFLKVPSPTSPLLKKYPIKYILFDDSMRGNYGVKPEIYSAVFKEVFVVGQYHVYAVGK